MRYALKLFCLSAALLLALSALPVTLAEEADDWTVLIYMCGSDLESKNGMASFNLNEISQTVPSSRDLLDKFGAVMMTDTSGLHVMEGKVNVLIETGGAKAWHARNLGLDIATDRLQRYAYDPLKFDGFRLMDEQPLASMGAPETLSDFIRWSVAARPAQKYALILWDHGGGSRTGLFVDELFEGDILYLDELSRALEGGGARFDTLIMDACMMANLETAQAVAPWADYMVASEELAPGYGGAYRMWINTLYYCPKYDGRQFACYACDAVQEKYANMGHEQACEILTWSAIDLSRIDAVSAAFDALFVNIGELYEDDPMLFNVFTTVISSAERYGMGDQTMGDERMVDICSVLQNRYAPLTLDPDARYNLLDALSGAVINTVKGMGRSEAYGLSFCYDPAMTPQALDIYARNCKSAPYLALLDAVNEDWTAPDWVYERTRRLKPLSECEGYDLNMSVRVADGHPQLMLTDSRARKHSVNYLLYREDPDTGEIYRLGRDTCNMIELAGDRIIYEMDALDTWPAIGGVLCDIEKVRENENYILYNIPVQIGSLNYQMRAAYLYDTTLLDQALDQLVRNVKPEGKRGDHLSLDYAGQYTLYGLWEGYDDNSAMPNRNIEAFSTLEGREFSLMYPVYAGMGSARTGWRVSDPLVMYRGLELEIAPLPEGTYYCVFQVVDVFGQWYNSDVIPMTLRDGQLWAEE